METDNLLIPCWYDFTDANEKTVDMFETFVPETLRGQGEEISVFKFMSI